MKKFIKTLSLFILAFALVGCSYRIVKTNDGQSVKPQETKQDQLESDKQFNAIWDASSNSPTTNNGQKTKQIETNPVISVDLQSKCASTAEEFFNKNGYKDKSEFYFSYQNHFNSKLNKCFILVSSQNFKDDSLYIDLYDALENKHYAIYLGHNNCDATSLSPAGNLKKCQLDSGNIWLDGDDSRNPSDYHFGFNGMANGGVGDANTLKLFMEQIKSFMND